MATWPATGGARSAVAVLAALAVADVAFAFQQTAVIPAIPTIQSDFHTAQTWSAWLVSGYLVASSIGTPLLGKLADRYGKRRLLSLALGLFLVGSIGAALSPGIGALIGFRALQGAGGAVFPLSLSVAREHLPEGRMGTGIGLLTGAFGLGTTIGFVVSGAIVEAASWRWIFGTGAIAILAGLVVVAMAVPRSEERSDAGLDLAGGALLTGGIALVLIAITEGVPLGWTSWQVIAAFVVGIAALCGWVWHDMHADEPLLDLSVLTSRPVLLTNAATLLLGHVLFGLFFLVPYLVQGSGKAGYGFGAGPFVTGLYLAPAAAGQLVTGSLSGIVASRLGAKWTFTLGMLLTSASGVWLALLHTAEWQVLLGTLLLGLGAGLGIGVASTLIAETAHGSETGISTALNSVLRRVGGGFGGQVGAALLASLTVAGGAASPRAFEIAFWTCGAVALAGTALAAAIRR